MNPLDLVDLFADDPDEVPCPDCGGSGMSDVMEPCMRCGEDGVVSRGTLSTRETLDLEMEQEHVWHAIPFDARVDEGLGEEEVDDPAGFIEDPQFDDET